MIESRTESLVNKLNTQRQERAAVRPSPSQLTFLPGMGLAAAHTEELAQLPTFTDNTISTSKDSIEIVKKQQFTIQYQQAKIQ